MKRTRTALLSCVAAGSVLALAVPASPASAGDFTARVTGRASTLPGAVEPATKGDSNDSIVSGNGRYVTFRSAARLVTSDTDDRGDVYVKDLLTDQPERVNVTVDGAPANAGATPGAISADGRFVVFQSTASNLTATPTNGKFQVYVRDRKLKTTELASVSSTEVLGNDNSPMDHDMRMDISDDGRYVAFSSIATNLGPDGDAFSDIFVRDRQGGTTSLISVSTAGVSTDNRSWGPSMSSDGRYVAFTSDATNLVNADTNNAVDVFRRDRQSTTTIRVSLHDNESEAPFGGGSGVMDDTGNKIAFVSANKLNGIDPNSTYDVYVRNISATTTTVGSVNKDGWAAGDSTDPGISGDGNTVAFTSDIPVVDAVDDNTKQVFVRVGSSATTRQSVSTAGAIANGDSYQPTLSTNGQVLAFYTNASNLVVGDTGQQDVIFRRWAPTGPFFDQTAFIQRQLFDFTGDASPGKVTAPKAAYDAGASPEHWLVGLAYDPAFAGKQPAAIRLYSAYFNRLPDKAGLAYWVKKLDTGMKLDQVSAKFAASNEFKTKYGNTTNAQFVTLVYANVLDRSPDQAGLDHWVAKLNTGMSRGSVMTIFSESNEGKRLMQPEVTSTLLGLGMLGKIPTGGLLTAMLGAAKADSAEAAAHTILVSAEYQAMVS